MIIHYLEKTSDLTGLTDWERERELNRIFAALYNDNHIVQEVIIDEEVCREDYESILRQRLSQIKQVEIRTVHGDALVAEMLQEMGDYLPRITRAIESISDLLYGEMNQEDWGYFSQLLESFGWVEQAVRIVLTQFNRSPGTDPLAEPFANFSHRLPQLLNEIEAAMERKEYVQAGDLIKYEIGELFQKLEQSVQGRVNV